MTDPNDSAVEQRVNYSLAECHGMIESGQLLEVIGFIGGTDPHCEAWIVKNVTGMDYMHLVQSLNKLLSRKGMAHDSMGDFAYKSVC